MSITASQRTRLGIFMIAGTVLLVLFIAIPLGFKLTDTKKDYYCYFEGQSLSGLEKGSVVKYYGMPIGKVTDIDYDPDNILRVKVEIEIEDDFPLKTDMYAQTGDIAITGMKYLDIKGGSNEADLLPPGSEVPTKPGLMQSLTANAEVIINKVEILLNHLNNLTHPDSIAGVKKIIDNVAMFTDDASGFLTEIRPDIEGSARHFEQIVSRLDSISRDVKVITGKTSTMMASGQLGEIMHSVDSSAQALKGVSEDISLIVKQSREDIMVSMENLREALENANQLTKVLSENPSLLLRGEQQRERVVR